jgi:hypothetical protein
MLIMDKGTKYHDSMESAKRYIETVYQRKETT